MAKRKRESEMSEGTVTGKVTTVDSEKPTVPATDAVDQVDVVVPEITQGDPAPTIDVAEEPATEEAVGGAPVVWVSPFSEKAVFPTSVFLTMALVALLESNSRTLIIESAQQVVHPDVIEFMRTKHAYRRMF